MAEFRTSAGLVSCTPMMRTSAGLVACTAVMYTTSGPVAGGGNLVASVDPETAGVSIYRKAPNSATTTMVTASATGGSGSYTYRWTIDDPDWKITSPTAATTAFQSPNLSPGDMVSTTARCVVTDSAGVTGTTSDVDVEASNNYEVG